MMSTIMNSTGMMIISAYLHDPQGRLLLAMIMIVIIVACAWRPELLECLVALAAVRKPNGRPVGDPVSDLRLPAPKARRSKRKAPSTRGSAKAKAKLTDGRGGGDLI